MSSKVNYFKIGLFVLAAFGALLTGLLLLSVRSLGLDVVMVETYLDESVQGLNVGSSVMQRGVEIGRVEKITFVTREYDMAYGSDNFWRYGKYVMIVMSVDRSHYPNFIGQQLQQVVDKWVNDKGLRMRIASQGLTGLAYMEVDYINSPKRYPPMTINWQPRSIYIPSVPSTKTSFVRSVESIFQSMDDVDFNGLAATLNSTLQSLDGALNAVDLAMSTVGQEVHEAQLGEIRQDVVTLVAELRQTNQLIQGLVKVDRDPKAEPNIPNAIAQLSQTLRRINQFVSGQQGDVDDILANIRRATDNLRVLTELAKKYPAHLLFGEAPPRPEDEK